METSIEFEYLLSHLFGKDNHHGDVGDMNISEWKKNLTKITKAIKKSIDQKVFYTDAYQRSEIEGITNKIESKILKSKSLNEINYVIILNYTKIIFNLLGHIPDNWNKKNASNKKFWKLDEFRSLGYTQNLKQKANLIIYLSDYSDYNKNMPSKIELERKLYIELKNNETEFIKWFKEFYPASYIKIF